MLFLAAVLHNERRPTYAPHLDHRVLVFLCGPMEQLEGVNNPPTNTLAFAIVKWAVRVSLYFFMSPFLSVHFRFAGNLRITAVSAHDLLHGCLASVSFVHFLSRANPAAASLLAIFEVPSLYVLKRPVITCLWSNSI